MDKNEIFEQALHLSPVDKLQLLECLTRSLDQPDEKIDKIWSEEAEKRYQALKEGKVKTIALDEILQRYR